MKYNENETFTMTYSSLLQKDGKKAICIRFERTEKGAQDFAEFLLPTCNILTYKGFDEEELSQLKIYLKGNKDSLLKKSKEISTITHWF